MQAAPFIPFAVSKGTNRTNSAGQFTPTGTARSGQTINNSIPAGGSQQFPASGKRFYLRATSAPINIRPKDAAWDQYTAGTGLDVDPGNLFNLVEVQNPNAYPVAYSLWVGFGGFIDRRLILETGITNQVFYITYSNPPLAGPVAINDLSGLPITDANGGQWLALARLAFYVDNPSVSNVSVMNAANTLVAGIVFPGTTRTFPVSGNYYVPGSSLNIEVQELYSVIPVIL